MYELSLNEIDEVSGGIWSQIVKWAEAIGLADMANEAINGFSDGFDQGLTQSAK